MPAVNSYPAPLVDMPGGAANKAGAITVNVANKVVGTRYYTSSSATSGTSYGHRFQHYVIGAAGSGAAVRAYGFTYGVAAANVYGLEASAEIHSTPSSAITGLMAGVKSDIILGLDSSGTNTALDLSYNVASGKAASLTASSFIRVSNSGSGTGCINLLSLPTVAAKTEANTAVFLARHADCTATHGIRVVDAAGTVYWIMVSTDTPGD